MKQPFTDEALELIRIIDLDDVPDDLDDQEGGTEEEGDDEDLDHDAFEAMTKGHWG